ncbi:MAG: DUF192 domain-containing protein [Rhodospirillales bacterium]|nr:DUF192 domain-containing protein [Rhodospirillales bacterium]
MIGPIHRRAAMGLIACFAVVGAMLAGTTPGAAQGAVSFPTSALTIEAAGGARHKFTVEIADTDDRRQLGLMHRTALAPDAGMLFDFKADQQVMMWMRNTRIPLDMLFIAHDGRVVNIAQRTVPFSEASVYSDGKVRAVLELNGGTAQRLNLKPGDRVIHPMFQTAR